jgi:salicylate hydroxylase
MRPGQRNAFGGNRQWFERAAPSEQECLARSRTILIAGAGIGGLVSALAVVQRGFRALVFEQAEHLEEIGAGIQLSPNATRILIELGVHEGLARVAVTPQAVRVLSGRTARELATTSLGSGAEQRYGAPYWVIHRADLQSVLFKAAQSRPDIELRLGARVEDFARHTRGITIQVRAPAGMVEEHGIALVGADGVWSGLRRRLGDAAGPRFAKRTAWRTLVPAALLAPEQRQPITSLWLGASAHLVHYPVRAATLINMVAIVDDPSLPTGRTAPGTRREITSKFANWAPEAQALVATAPDPWLKWPLYDRPPWRHWSRGVVTLVGDAAHPMLPFLAQGGAMAIEDAWVLAQCLGRTPNDPASAFEYYQRVRRHRTARVARHARLNGRIYHLRGPAALARDLAFRTLGGEYLLDRYDWLYGWRPH